MHATTILDESVYVNAKTSWHTPKYSLQCLDFGRNKSHDTVFGHCGIGMGKCMAHGEAITGIHTLHFPAVGHISRNMQRYVERDRFVV